MIKEIIAFVFSKHFLKHLGLIMLFYVSVVLIMMVYLYFYTNHGEKIEVPNFVGMNSEKAKVVIEDLGLEFQIMDSIYDPNLPEGTVKEQSPKSTAFTLLFVKSGRTISLRVSKKTDLIAMPSLIFKQITVGHRFQIPPLEYPNTRPILTCNSVQVSLLSGVYLWLIQERG